MCLQGEAPETSGHIFALRAVQVLFKAQVCVYETMTISARMQTDARTHTYKKKILVLNTVYKDSLCELEYFNFVLYKHACQMVSIKYIIQFD